MSKLRHGARFSNTGLGQTPSPNSIFGLTRAERSRRYYFAKKMKWLKEQALKGDKKAEKRLRKWILANAKAAQSRSKRPVTKVKLAFLERGK